MELEKIKEKKIFSPSEYMRSRHPDLFSDTQKLSEPILTKGLLEYHLDTLTNRKQEFLFEEFSRRLVELEICPNIKPQTGPVGGGDSGYDASTYPVARLLIDRAWWGNPNPPADETWGFAFSCKKKWTDKVNADVKKISKLDKKFSKVYFITNQFTRDKTRDRKESELSRQYGFEVIILDRTWIVNKVIDNKHENLAIDLLELKVMQIEKPHYGPLDISRLNELENLEKKFKDTEVYFDNDFLLARDYMRAGILSRGLEKPRSIIDGYFTRSREIAKNVGIPSQIIRCGYNHAWTTFWWFEDYQQFLNIYEDIEEFINETSEADDCELFINLWLLLLSIKDKVSLKSIKMKIEKRSEIIRDALKKIISDIKRPNNALYANIQLNFFELINGVINEDHKIIETSILNIKEDISKSTGLATFPYMKIINRFLSVSFFFRKYPGYDSLFDVIQKNSKDRISENHEGELYYIRGFQALEDLDVKETLRYLGQAKVRLTKEETLQKSIRASIGCSDAYMAMGFYWAAREEVLNATFLSTRIVSDEVIKYPYETLLSAKRICWLELRLGRISSFIKWHNFTWTILNYLKSLDYDVSIFEEELLIQDSVLGCFFLNLDCEKIITLGKLLKVLEQKGLIMSDLALRYVLKGVEDVQDDFPEEISSSIEKVNKYFSVWKNNPASEQVPNEIYTEFSDYRHFTTTILGVKYTFTVRNLLGPLLISDNLLGIIEAALALAKWENLAFVVDETSIIVDIDPSGNDPPMEMISCEPDLDGYYLIWSTNLLNSLKEKPHEFRDFFKMLLFKILLESTIDPIQDIEEEFERLHSEDTFSRALSMAPSGISVLSLFGDNFYDL